MSMKEKKTIIIDAIRKLGIDASSVNITQDEDTIGNVYVNGEYFGAFDYLKKTFID